MKKQMLMVIALAFCSFQTFGQIQIPGTVSGGQANANNIGGTSINISNINTPGSNNVFLGQGSGNGSSSGNQNTIIGQGTGSALSSGSNNTFLGAWTGTATNVGGANTFLGFYSGIANTTGGGNVFVGQGSATTNTEGSVNVFLGHAAGNGNTTGSSNVAIGKYAQFSTGGLNYATVIGADAQATQSNTMILGGTTGSASAVNVGLGTSTPSAHIHTVNNQSEEVIFSTTSTSNSSESKLMLRAPGGFPPNNDVKLISHANTNTLTLLPAVGGTPAISLSNMAALFTEGQSLAVGMDGLEKRGSIHFINYVDNGSGGFNRAECMRINKDNGFVGVHTRRASSATGSGEPQALFHVNLTNPVNRNLNTLTQGIRFEGLPIAQYDTVIVIDTNGNLAKRVYPTGGTPANAWLLNGNSTTGSEFIGTLTSDDFRIRTNNNQVAMYTTNGNFDLGSAGSNNLSAATSVSAAMGINNNIDGGTASMAVGLDNTIQNSTYSATFGEDNNINSNSTRSQATGNSHNITQSNDVFAAGASHEIINSFSVAALGGRDRIENSDESVVAGEDNQLFNSHGSFIGGGHNIMGGVYDVINGGHNTLDGNFTYIGGESNTSTGDYNMLLGHYLEGGSSAAVAPATATGDNIMLIGERINNDLQRSLCVGFNGNKTTVINETGMAVQLDPANGNTYTPTVNFEVDAAIAPSPGPQPITTPQSNIRFHNLPQDPMGRSLPAVLIDPATGELFQSQNLYMRPGKDNGSQNLDSIYEENNALKERVAQLESQIAVYDSKFTQLEDALNQICDRGCVGLKGIGGDELYQSTPNPTGNNATINYRLARDYSNAHITIYSMNGTELNTYNLNPGQGEGSVNISLDDLQSGAYIYRLVVDGNAVDVKKLQKL